MATWEKSVLTAPASVSAAGVTATAAAGNAPTDTTCRAAGTMRFAVAGRTVVGCGAL